MRTVVVRYKTRPEAADENQRMVEAVFAELHARSPGGTSYATYRLTDDTFVHVAQFDSDDNPLTELAAFAAFQAGLGERCLPGEGPQAGTGVQIGSYGP